MTNIDQKYDNLINRIKTTSPPLSDPQELSTEIMSIIGKLPNRPKTSIVLKSIALTSSIAATLLLGVFLSEHLIAPAAPYTEQINISNNTLYSPVDFNSDRDNDNSLSHLNNIIREKREQREARETFYATIINKYQTF